MSNEDAYIQNYVKANDFVTDYWLEVPYNYYGERGYADCIFGTIVPEEDYKYYSVVEVKSEAAIREATGANEIIRQFNKMSSYYIDGQNKRIVDSEQYTFQLHFIKSDVSIQHLHDNWELYNNLHEETSEFPRKQVILGSKNARERMFLNYISRQDLFSDSPFEPWES